MAPKKVCAKRASCVCVGVDGPSQASLFVVGVFVRRRHLYPSLTLSVRRQLGRDQMSCFLEYRGLGTPDLFFERLLCRLPCRSQFSIHRLARGGQHPAPLSAVAAGRILHQAAFLDESQGSRRSRLIDADRSGKLRRRQIRGCAQHLQHRVLRGVQAAVGERGFVQRGHRPRGLAQRRAIAGKRQQFHGGYLWNEQYMYMHAMSNFDLATPRSRPGCANLLAVCLV